MRSFQTEGTQQSRERLGSVAPPKRRAALVKTARDSVSSSTASQAKANSFFLGRRYPRTKAINCLSSERGNHTGSVLRTPSSVHLDPAMHR